jgi:cytochrome c oxidase subunit 2
MKLLILLVIVLGVIAIAQLTKVYELTRSLRKTREEEISHADNKMNATLMLVWMVVFFFFTIFLYVRYGDYLPESASAHGVEVDKLMSLNLWMVTVMFFIVNGVLFYVAGKYYYRKDRKARFFVHDNRLEMIWTMVPGVTMAFIIVYGLITWNNMTGPAGADAVQIEIYSRQFDWAARYPGADKTFGSANVNLISGTNAMGMVSEESISAEIHAIDSMINSIESTLKANSELPTMPESAVEVMKDQLYRHKRHKQRILDLKEFDMQGVSGWKAGSDDKIVKGEFHMPKGKEVEFIFKSQDVIHSAFMPHFRAQMNTVPGVPTRFKMTPTISTNEMRVKLNDPEFNYVLYCNKVCGVTHFNMQITVVVDEPAEYEAWLTKQKTFGGAATVAPAAEPAPATSPADTSNTGAALATALNN